MLLNTNRAYALTTTAWMVDRLEQDFAHVLPLGVRDALHNVLDCIDKEQTHE